MATTTVSRESTRGETNAPTPAQLDTGRYSDRGRTCRAAPAGRAGPPATALAALLLGLAPLGAAAAEPTASAQLVDAQGSVVGTVTFEQAAEGVRIRGQVRGLPPGAHGMHVHAAGACDGPAFTTAGGHFNPGGHKHGLKSSEGGHAGDLPNLQVAADGGARIDAVAHGATLGAAGVTLLDADGSALVIHAGPDDELTDPAGNSGGRIVCGVIRVAAVAPTQLPRTGEPLLGLVGLGAIVLAAVGAWWRRR